MIHSSSVNWGRKLLLWRCISLLIMLLLSQTAQYSDMSFVCHTLTFSAMLRCFSIPFLTLDSHTKFPVTDRIYVKYSKIATLGGNGSPQPGLLVSVIKYPSIFVYLYIRGAYPRFLVQRSGRFFCYFCCQYFAALVTLLRDFFTTFFLCSLRSYAERRSQTPRGHLTAPFF